MVTGEARLAFLGHDATARPTVRAKLPVVGVSLSEGLGVTARLAFLGLCELENRFSIELKKLHRLRCF